MQMDHRRNELVATDLFVSIVTAGFAWVAMIAGIYGMNLHPCEHRVGGCLPDEPDEQRHA